MSIASNYFFLMKSSEHDLKQDPHPEPGPNPDPHPEPDPNPDPHPEPDQNPDPELDPNPDPEPDPNPDPLQCESLVMVNSTRSKILKNKFSFNIEK